MVKKKEEKEKVQIEGTRQPVETDNSKIGDTPPPLPSREEYKVIQAFRDKNTFEVYAIGDVYEAESKRIKELQSLGFLGEEVKGSDGNEGK